MWIVEVGVSQDETGPRKKHKALFENYQSKKKKVRVGLKWCSA
jgi:hypothetical protein